MLGLGSSLTGGVALGLSASAYSSTFDGTGDYIDFTETTFEMNAAGENLSIAFWAKRADTNSDLKTVLGSSTSNNLKRLWFASATQLRIESDTNGQDAYCAVTGDTNWHHYTVTMAGANSAQATVVMYEDGAAVSTTNNNFGNTASITLGQIGFQANNHEFIGQLYQVATWDVTLDADAVAAIYNSGTPIPLQEDKGNYDNSEDLTHLWMFSEGTGSTTADSIGSLTGTFAGDATFSTTTP